MNKFIRLMIMIILVLGIIFVAKSQIAGANPSAGPSLSSAHDQAQAVNADKNDDCKNNKDKCKGSVKPPPRSIHISGTGNYSVGGFCTLSVVFNDPVISLDAAIQAPLPRELPDTVHRIRQGCLLIYYASGQRIGAIESIRDISARKKNEEKPVKK